MNFAQATILGNVGADPRSNAAGAKSVVSFAIAVNRVVKGEKTTMWVSISCWDDRKNKIIEQYVRKGSQIMVQGFPSVRSYKNKSGEMVSTLEIDISFGTVTLLAGKSDAVEPEVKQKTVEENYDEIPF